MRGLERHTERHLVARIGWLRAAVLGANDGLVSTASLVLGVAAASAARGDILIAGVAGLVAGAMSMADVRARNRVPGWPRRNHAVERYSHSLIAFAVAASSAAAPKPPGSGAVSRSNAALLRASHVLLHSTGFNSSRSELLIFLLASTRLNGESNG